jgi:hypothetical protein
VPRMYHPLLRPAVVTVADDDTDRMQAWGWRLLADDEDPPTPDSDHAGFGYSPFGGTPA